MNRAIIASLACALAFAGAAAAQVKDSAVVVGQAEAVVTVTKVDAKARTVTFRGPQGNLATMNVPPESQNLDQVKPGQQFRMKYVEAVAVAISRGGGASATAAKEVTLAPKGAKPGGMVVSTVQISGVIEAIDHANRQFAIRGPKGNVRSFKAAEGVSVNELSAGDRVSIVHTEALAIEMVEQPKKAPAKKAEKKS
jgi:hypothetical protein